MLKKHISLNQNETVYDDVYNSKDRYEKYFNPDEDRWYFGKEALIGRFTGKLIDALNRADGYVRPDRHADDYLVLECRDKNGNEKGYWIGLYYDDSEKTFTAEATFDDSEYLCDLPEELSDDIDLYCQQNDKFLNEYTDYGFTAYSAMQPGARFLTTITGVFEMKIEATDQWDEYISTVFDLIDRLSDLADMEDITQQYNIYHGEPSMSYLAEKAKESAMTYADGKNAVCNAVPAADTAPVCCCRRCPCFSCGSSIK